MAEDRYNLKNPAVKRILQEVKEMQSNPSDDFMSLPLEPNGRFETQTKICLSISNHHPEHWQPSWSVRTALVALIAFMPSSPNGALGSLDYKKEERHALAIKSREAPPKFGTPERQKLIDEIHEYMWSKAPPVPQLSPSQASKEHPTNSDGGPQANQQDSVNMVAENRPLNQQDSVEEEPLAPANANPGNAEMRMRAAVSEIPAREPSHQQLRRPPEMRVQRSADDRLFTWAAVGLTIAILVLLFKKFTKSSGPGAVFMGGS
ncbi:ubiquitin-conjugating enzyme E2 32-like isoform X2 [Hibiscus syriacus]|uniref:ubiquitin-conjugating enzyme E2 32-like isoform X2 n=1 Tax=Hibiscus syriacus TaxID=106335 RepID=UPI001922020F|nr:ubiquitin-conjugating enzyme E2 32-like isoform X2 [Hibiscus syriacus]